MSIETFMGLARAAGHDALPIPPKKQAMGNAPFDAAGKGRRGAGWNTTRLGINTLLFAHGEEIRSRSRDAVRNNGWASAAVDSYVANAIGRGIRLIPQHPDPKVRKAILDLWNRWIKESDVEYEPANRCSGQSDFYGQQATLAREVMEAGECFVRFRVRPAREKLSVPLQIQLIESEQLPLWRIQNDGVAGDNVVRSGIEFRQDGRREAYHFWKAHPGETLYFPLDGLQTERVSAKDILHVFKPIRAGQFRGQPWLTPVLAKLYELDQYVDAELVRKKTAAMITGFIKQVSPDNQILPADPNQETDDPGAAIAKLEPGTFPVLNPGEDVTLAQIHESGSAENFIRVMLHAFAIGGGLTYEQISGDLSRVNFSSIRAGLLEMRRKCEQVQRNVFIFQLCHPVFRRWLLEAVLSRALVLPGGTLDTGDRYPGYFAAQYEYENVRWALPGWPWVNPKDDIEATVMAIRGGLTTRTAEAAERGMDSTTIDLEQASDHEREDELGLVYDSNPTKVLLMRETNPSTPQPKPPSDDNHPVQDQEETATQNQVDAA